MTSNWHLAIETLGLQEQWAIALKKFQMTLIELHAEFIHYINDQSFDRVDNIGNADGILFLCPKCFAHTGNSYNVHSVICWEPNVPQTCTPGPGRWTLEADVTLSGIPLSSVVLTSGCLAHFFVKNGSIMMC